MSKRILFIVGNILFSITFFMLLAWSYRVMSEDAFGKRVFPQYFNARLYMATLFFVVGAYLVSNNRPSNE